MSDASAHAAAARDQDADPARQPRAATSFLITKEHRRFVEFAEACRRERYIGVCFGPPGVGKTLSARHYTAWEQIDPWLDRYYAGDRDREPPAVLKDARCAFYTPQVTTTPRRLEEAISILCIDLENLVEDQLHPERDHFHDPRPQPSHVQLLIVDEADRLKTTALEVLRDYFDRHDIGLVLIGMPGLERRLARYPQLYSRIGFAHHYRPLGADELRFVLTHHWHTLGLQLTADDFTDTEAIATVARITDGNFRLVNRLFAQIKRILEINQLATITREVIEAAREGLVIGQQ